jgi:hypothetical protein
MDHSRWEWILTALEIIENGKHVRRFLYACLAVAIIYVIPSILNAIAVLQKG